jgi:hypothetical protein
VTRWNLLGRKVHENSLGESKAGPAENKLKQNKNGSILLAGWKIPDNQNNSSIIDLSEKELDNFYRDY